MKVTVWWRLHSTPTVYLDVEEVHRSANFVTLIMTDSIKDVDIPWDAAERLEYEPQLEVDKETSA